MRVLSLPLPGRILAPHPAWDTERLDDMVASLRSGGSLALPPLVAYPHPDGGWQAITGSHRLVAYKRAGLPCPVFAVAKNVLDRVAQAHGLSGIEDVRDFAAFAALLANDIPELAEVLEAQEESFVGRPIPEGAPTFTSGQRRSS